MPGSSPTSIGSTPWSKRRPVASTVLFANAGIYEFGTLGKITEEHFDKVFDTNVRGLHFTVRKVLPLLSDGASVILTGSIASSFGTPSMSVYSATKAAVRSFARSWILDLKDRGIRVNVLSPGHTASRASTCC
jgi:NAD(P)-dependent dehydrogenase (short-subunit alcohol dehydrogenase family)